MCITKTTASVIRCEDLSEEKEGGGEAGERTAVLSVGVGGWELEDVVEPQKAHSQQRLYFYWPALAHISATVAYVTYPSTRSPSFLCSGGKTDGYLSVFAPTG